MNKMSTFIVLAGIAALSACASDEVVMNDTAAKEDMAAEQPAAAMPEAMTHDKAMMTEKPATKPAEPVAPAAMPETSSASYGSGNLVSACVYGDQKRVISVVYDNDTTGNVCEVTYEKSTGVQTLWSAQNDRDYCLDRAMEFVEKQKGWGWVCSNLE